MTLNKEEIETFKKKALNVMKSQMTRNKYNNSAERTPTPISPRFHPESGEETRNPNNKPLIRLRRKKSLELVIC